jgi:hypothetical protein
MIRQLVEPLQLLIIGPVRHRLRWIRRCLRLILLIKDTGGDENLRNQSSLGQGKTICQRSSGCQIEAS